MDFNLGDCYSIALTKGGYGGFFISELREEFNGYLNLGVTPVDLVIHDMPAIGDFLNASCIVIYHENFGKGGVQTYNIWPANFLKCGNIRYVGKLNLNIDELENVICGPIGSINPSGHLEKTTSWRAFVTRAICSRGRILIINKGIELSEFAFVMRGFQILNIVVVNI